MRYATPTYQPAFVLLPPAAAGAIEREEFPSPAGSLASRMGADDASPDRRRAAIARAGAIAPALQRNAPWAATLPAPLESTTRSEEFRELDGVAIREVTEPDIFRHFFGR